MLFEADKVMFEIYRETEYTNKFKVVYFTELQDHNKESEINRALAGEHFFDGFIKNTGKEEAKEIIGELLTRLNNGEKVDAQEVVDYCAARNIKADIELIRPDEINRAYERVVHKDVRYRFVIDMASLKTAGSRE